MRQVKTSVTVLSSCLQLHKYSKKENTVVYKNTYSNRRVANHLHGLIFELKERMNSRQDRPVMRVLCKLHWKCNTRICALLFFTLRFHS